MKINWGWGISISIIAFTIITLWFVYFAFNHDVNLVREDYYEAEVEYDTKMETVKRTKELKSDVEVNVSDDFVTIVFPNLFDYDNISGNILLYRPSNRENDIEIPVKLDSTNFQLIPRKEIKLGMWKIQIDWSVDSIKYFSEKVIMVQ